MDQQIARHFVHNSGCLYHPPSLTQQIWLTVVSHPDLDGEDLDSSPGHTKYFKKGT